MATIEIFTAFRAGIKPCDVIMHKIYCVKLIIYSQESYRFNRSGQIYRQVCQQMATEGQVQRPKTPPPPTPIPPLLQPPLQPPPTILRRQNDDVSGQAGVQQG
jgi:hypothetical protein